MSLFRMLMRSAAIAAAASLAVTVAVEALAKDPERPYRSSCSAVVTPLTPPGVFPQELSLAYVCQVAHLGRTTGDALQFVIPVSQSGEVITALIENVTTYTAANGDTLNVAFSGTALINTKTGNVRLMGTETFTGGTGRFAGATGTAEAEGMASIFTNRGFFITEGSISY